MDRTRELEEELAELQHSNHRYRARGELLYHQLKQARREIDQLREQLAEATAQCPPSD